MRYALIADLHGKMDSFERIREAAVESSVDAMYFLGDYLDSKVSKREHDPAVRWDPDRVVDFDPMLWKQLGAHVLVRGNQEERIAELLRRDQVPPQLAQLLSRPSRVRGDELLMVHGHQFDWARVGDHWLPGAADLVSFDRPVVCYGHSHERLAARLAGPDPGDAELIPVGTGEAVRLVPGERYVFNLGAARERRGHWLLYDSAERTATFREACA